MGRRWIGAWALQIIEIFAVCLLAALAEGAGPWVRGAMLWLVVPLAGFVTAWRAVGRGLNNYLAWLAPLACLYGANMLLWGYAPPAGPALVAALAALTGAAAGEVARHRREKKPHSRRARR